MHTSLSVLFVVIRWSSIGGKVGTLKPTLDLCLSNTETFLSSLTCAFPSSQVLSKNVNCHLAENVFQTLVCAPVKRGTRAL